MSNIIDIASRRSGRSALMQWAIKRCFELGQPLIIGCTDREKKYNELREIFPDAELEIVGLGVKIWKRK